MLGEAAEPAAAAAREADAHWAELDAIAGRRDPQDHDVRSRQFPRARSLLPRRGRRSWHRVVPPRAAPRHRARRISRTRELDNAVRCICAPLLLAMLWRHSSAAMRRWPLRPGAICETQLKLLLDGLALRPAAPVVQRTERTATPGAGADRDHPPVRPAQGARVREGTIESRPRHEPNRGEAANSSRAAEPAERLIEARQPDGRPAPTPSRGPRHGRAGAAGCWLIALIAILVIGAIGGGADWWLQARNWVSTDDAFIDTHTVQVRRRSPDGSRRVSGQRQPGGPAPASRSSSSIRPISKRALSQALANQAERARAAWPRPRRSCRSRYANLDAGASRGRRRPGHRDECGKPTSSATRCWQQMGGLAVSRQQLDNDTATARSDRRQSRRRAAKGRCEPRRSMALE